MVQHTSPPQNYFKGAWVIWQLGMLHYHSPWRPSASRFRQACRKGWWANHPPGDTASPGFGERGAGMLRGCSLHQVVLVPPGSTCQLGRAPA